jgi:Tol biopolymer transport system component
MHRREGGRIMKRTLFAALLVLSTAVGMGAWAAAAEAAYSAKNGMIAFTRRVPGNEGFWGIHTVNPDGTGLNRLSDKAAPLWSPDGTKLLFSVYPLFGYADIHVMNANGTGVRQLTEGIAAWSASWSPDGSKIAYKKAKGGNAADGELWTMNADGSGKTQITFDGCAKLGLDWGRTAGGVSKIAFIGSCPSVWGLYLINPDGTGLQLVDAVSPEVAGGTQSLDWSPDGSRIALSSAMLEPTSCPVNNMPEDIYVVNLTTGTTTNITNTRTCAGPFERDPAWSPDGTRIAYAAASIVPIGGTSWFGPQAIYTMSPSGGGIVKVTDPPVVDTGTYSAQSADGGPDWQPCLAGVTGSCSSQTTGQSGGSGGGSAGGPGGGGAGASGTGTGSGRGPEDSIGSGAPARVLVDSFSVPARAKAGRLLVARLGVRSEDGGAITSASVTCRAHVRGRAVRVLARGMRSGGAFCTWRVPAKLRGRTLHGLIRVTVGQAVASKIFRRMIR